MDRVLTDEELRASIARMPAREEPDFLRPVVKPLAADEPAPTMSVEGFKSGLLKRRLKELALADGARLVRKTAIAREVRAIKQELRLTKARGARSRVMRRHREIVEETREARTEAERARRRVEQIRSELEEERKDIQKAIESEREERQKSIKENEKKRAERKAVLEEELERKSAKRHKLVASLKDVIAQQGEARKVIVDAGGVN